MTLELRGGFRFSPSVEGAGVPLPFGMVTARNISMDRLSQEISRLRPLAVERLQADLARIRRRVQAVSDFFESRGFPCPLPEQLRSVQNRGFPRISPLVDTLLICEITSGVLMGVQDLDRIEGEIVYDMAREGETFEGIRQTIQCHSGEIVLRDGTDIIASYYQGPDRRTRVTRQTSAAVFFAFGAPGLPLSAVSDALSMAHSAVALAAEQMDFMLWPPLEKEDNHAATV